VQLLLGEDLVAISYVREQEEIGIGDGEPDGAGGGDAGARNSRDRSAGD